MKKIFILTASIMFLTGCVETVALLGPASSVLGGGNVIHSSVSSAVSYGVKKKTGKSPMQHALAYAEDNNPNNKKDRCISFVKKTESEACYIAKKKISSIKKNTVKKIKNVITPVKSKVVKKYTGEQKLPLQAEAKKVTFKNVKTEKELQLKSVESMLIESALNKKQISHLRVSIEKRSKIKQSNK